MKHEFGSRGWLLSELIKSYENSSLFKKGEGHRRILLSSTNKRKLTTWLEDSRNSDRFFSDLRELHSDGIVDFSWEKYFEGSVIENIWLCQEEDAIRKAYAILGTRPKSDSLDGLSHAMNKAIEDIGRSGSDVSQYLQEKLSDIECKRRAPAPFTGTDEHLDNLFKALVFIAVNERSEKMRLVSTRLYGDSKVFENDVLGGVLSVLHDIYRKSDPDDGKISDDELLAERGIVKNSEILGFRGNISVETPYGTIDYSGAIKGAYINSSTVHDVSRAIPHGIKTVTTIENLANYEDYIEKTMDVEELVIYHGGCYSPVKGEWLKKIHDSLAGTGASFRHWSDIDYGGFNIFVRLRDNIIPELVPYKMDTETLAGASICKSLGSDEYRKKLESLLDDERYEVFHSVIRYMLENDKKLEQESLIID